MRTHQSKCAKSISWSRFRLLCSASVTLMLAQHQNQGSDGITPLRSKLFRGIPWVEVGGRVACSLAGAMLSRLPRGDSAGAAPPRKHAFETCRFAGKTCLVGDDGRLWLLALHHAFAASPTAYYRCERAAKAWHPNRKDATLPLHHAFAASPTAYYRCERAAKAWHPNRKDATLPAKPICFDRRGRRVTMQPELSNQWFDVINGRTTRCACYLTC